MIRSADAVIEPNGTVRLLSPLTVTEPTRAVVTLVEESAPAPPVERPPPRTLEEALKEIKDAKTLDELFAAMDRSAPFDTPDPEGYDLEKAIQENRKTPMFRSVNLKELGYDDE